ncbi:MAG: CDP-glycerol glycerophosphotransferase family protein [Eubacterium sp.]|nr:CDP-glycerol glycerophosphotransferase family protein [Eubacterium sp.]
MTGESGKVHIIIKEERDSFIQEFNTFLDEHGDGYLLVLSPQDRISGEVLEDISQQGEENVLSGRAGERAYSLANELADYLDENPEAALVTPKTFFDFPDRITGVMIRLSVISEISRAEGGKLRLRSQLKYNYEADFLLRLIENHAFLVKQKTKLKYKQGEPGDEDFREFIGIYDKVWYLNNMKDFLLPMLEGYKQKGDIPYIVQLYSMYNIKCRLDANKNNANRHILNEEEIQIFKERINQVLSYIDDEIIMSVLRYPVYKRDFQLSRMLLRLKYFGAEEGSSTDSHDAAQNIRPCPGTTFKGFEALQDMEEYLAELDYIPEDFFHTVNVRYPALFIMQNGLPVHSSSVLRCNIQFMDYRNGCLEIDGSFPDIYYRDKIKYYFEINGRRYEPEWCERYSLTKYFGESAYKRYPFHVSIPIDDIYDSVFKKERNVLRFFIEYDSSPYEIAYEFKSHTSRLAAYPINSYWHAGKWLLTTSQIETEKGGHLATGIVISEYSWSDMASKEIATGWELLTSFKMHRFRFWLQRAAWVITRPYFKNKDIWMFFDKIYKGGDSSEYLYKYACKMQEEKNQNRKKRKLYYLLDKSSTDYERLKNEGYKPLKRGSFLHRLVFLNANMMVVSNSTVFAFNDYYLENSRYIRGIVDFHTVCVQHGLSVQKIALAQQRLRDNTRLYFCASRYEIENLSRPVYDYVGYDALRLTGVPRYDGLIDNDKKQIMISPTWRMQSAMLVTKNEGVQRDYNPNFRDTPYFKVYNRLINDKKLIAAAKKYGYRIAYVLHPIVSSQAEDFDKNDFVDIIPSVGDMSYEKMFCESSLMVTDYSGIQFDFAYMRKPLVYYHPDELEAHYEEGTFHYDTMAFGEIVHKKDELVELLVDYMKEGCKMKELYKMRADDFFEFDDRNNCQRIYDEIEKYCLEHE